MAALRNVAYTAMRTQQVASWFMEIRDDVGAAVLRVDSSDPRLTVGDDDGTDTVTFTLVLAGDDAEISLPETVESSVLFDLGAGGNQMTEVEAFTPFTLGDPADQVTIVHTVTLPAP
mgnify:CR=1 FL=1